MPNNFWTGFKSEQYLDNNVYSIPCTNCNGNGWRGYLERNTCTKCNGTGKTIGTTQEYLAYANFGNKALEKCLKH